jgi:predicted RNA binding protein YcfA (HicA-like mRNA interferase family)
LLKADGWRELRQAGSHIHFTHPTKPGRLIVPYQAGKELHQGLATDLLKKAGLR